MPKTLSAFIRDQLIAQQLSEKDLAKRSGLGLSHIYQILRGERKHTRSDTLDKIAVAFNMTPADMAVAMGKASADLHPDEAELLAIYRQVPTDQRASAKGMLRGLSVQPIRPPRANRVRQPRANSSVPAGVELEPDSQHEGKISPSAEITPDSHTVLGRGQRAHPRVSHRS